ncbi:hypothetical protein [uncultured Roseobacter sp.]|uniref:hypothetical protein n=1 Tax=uncultured Roseobacter sp. TaxID=114847 RepID=UPI00260652C6|nr:hypothetical protein [uncultured Roseobacter sp.]
MMTRLITGVVVVVLAVTPAVGQVSQAQPRETTELKLGDDGACFVDDKPPLATGGAEGGAALSILAGALVKAGASAAVSFARAFVQHRIDANTPPPVIVSKGALAVQLDPREDGGTDASSPLTCISVNHGVRKLDDSPRDAATIERVMGLDRFKHFHEGDDAEEFDPVDLNEMDLLLPPEVYAEIWLDWHQAQAFRPFLGAVYLREPLEAINSRRTVDLAITVTISSPGGVQETAFAFALTELTPGKFYPAGYFTTSSPWIANPATPSDEDLKMEIENPVRTGLVNVQVTLQQSQEPGLLLSYSNQMMSLLDTATVENATSSALNDLLGLAE